MTKELNKEDIIEAINVYEKCREYSEAASERAREAGLDYKEFLITVAMQDTVVSLYDSEDYSGAKQFVEAMGELARRTKDEPKSFIKEMEKLLKEMNDGQQPQNTVRH